MATMQREHLEEAVAKFLRERTVRNCIYLPLTYAERDFAIRERRLLKTPIRIEHALLRRLGTDRGKIARLCAARTLRGFLCLRRIAAARGCLLLNPKVQPFFNSAMIADAEHAETSTVEAIICEPYQSL